MKIKDNFWLGMLAGLLCFWVTFLPLYFLVNWDSLGIFSLRAPYVLSFIPGIILFRMMLVKWNREKMARGMLVFTLVGMLLVLILLSVFKPT